MYQPPNSPNCNTFFRAIQSIQYKKISRKMDELIANAMEAFDDLPLDVCKRVWSTTQIVTNSILLVDGSNNYAIPHVGKLKLARLLGQDLPLRLPCRALIANKNIHSDAISAFVAAGENRNTNDLGETPPLFLFDC